MTDSARQPEQASSADATTREQTLPPLTAPPELAAAIRAALGHDQSRSAADLLEAAGRLLEKALKSGCETRESAIDLLTVDALMTEALEVAARDPHLLERFPELAMRRIAAQAGEQ